MNYTTKEKRPKAVLKIGKKKEKAGDTDHKVGQDKLVNWRTIRSHWLTEQEQRKIIRIKNLYKDLYNNTLSNSYFNQAR